MKQTNRLRNTETENGFSNDLFVKKKNKTEKENWVDAPVRDAELLQSADRIARDAVVVR